MRDTAKFKRWERPFAVQANTPLCEALAGLSKEARFDAFLQLAILVGARQDQLEQAVWRAEVNDSVRAVNEASAAFGKAGEAFDTPGLALDPDASLALLEQRDRLWARLERAWKRNDALCRRGPRSFTSDQPTWGLPRRKDPAPPPK